MYKKKNWTKITEGFWSNDYYIGCYTVDFIYFRYPKTFNEIRQNNAAVQDGHHVRGKRRRWSIPTCWDDISISQTYGKDWKRYTKKRHQWQK